MVFGLMFAVGVGDIPIQECPQRRLDPFGVLADKQQALHAGQAVIANFLDCEGAFRCTVVTQGAYDQGNGGDGRKTRDQFLANSDILQVHHGRSVLRRLAYAWSWKICANIGHKKGNVRNRLARTRLNGA